MVKNEALEKLLKLILDFQNIGFLFGSDDIDYPEFSKRGDEQWDEMLRLLSELIAK